MLATGHHVVSFVTISEIEKIVLVADSCRPARGEATTGKGTCFVLKLIICLAETTYRRQVVRMNIGTGPRLEESTPFLRLCIIDYF